MNSGLVSWLAPFLCMLFSARLANAFLRNNPRLYTAMALFACCWAILLPYYSGTVQPSNMFRAISGFLLVYIGGLLMLEAQSRSGQSRHDAILPWQAAGLWLLILVAAPPIGNHLNIYSERQAELAVGIALDIAGFLSITIGTSWLCGKTAGTIVGTILAVYAAGELLLAYRLWPIIDSASATPTIPEPLRYGFAAGKMTIAATFGSIIAYTGMDQKVRDRGVLYWLLMIPGFAAHPAYDLEHR